MKIKKFFLFILLTAVFLLSEKTIMGEEIESPPPCHTISLTGTNVSCFGFSDGSATLSINGGSGNFTIIWSTGATATTSLSNLPAGYYDVRVVDNVYGCTAFDIISITEPSLLTTSIIGNNINCFGDSTGSINLTIAGGTAPYSILWSNLETTSSLSNLPVGEYSVRVIDSRGCIVRDSVELIQPLQPLGSDYLIKNILCFGNSNGSIDLNVWGGTPPYAYNWNENTFFSQDINMIPVGFYNVVITDSKGCHKYHSIEITGPELLRSVSLKTDNNCYGETNGRAEITVSGGTLPYSYSWANSDFLLSYNTPSINNLSNNHYYVTVTDHNGCTLNTSYVIESPSQLTYSISSVDVTALGGTDGQIYFSVSGGVGPYAYSWSNGISTADNLNVTSGIYQITVLDMNNCILEASIQIFEPLEALSFSYISKNTSCHGSADGEVFAYATGGTPPYRYQWSTGSSLSYLSGVSSGSYVLTLTDFNNVQFVDTVIITQPQPFHFSHIINSPSCHLFNNGNIDLTISGGTAPYRYHWYDSHFALAGLNQDLSNVSAGQYTVEITDTFGCISNYSVIVNQPQPLNLSIIGGNIQCTGGSNGNLSTTVSGGTTPYIYLWSNGQTTPNISFIPAGEYSLTVSDANGCLVYASAKILEPEPITINLTAYPTSCIDQTDGAITSIISGGSSGYQYFWSNGATEGDLISIPAGDYVLSVSDVFGCVASASIKVSRSNVACLSVPNTFSPNGDGINDTWVIKNIELYPDSYMQVFNKWGTSVFESQSYLDSWDGNYQGNPLPAETYYYILSFAKSLETLTGTITIIK